MPHATPLPANPTVTGLLCCVWCVVERHARVGSLDRGLLTVSSEGHQACMKGQEVTGQANPTGATVCRFGIMIQSTCVRCSARNVWVALQMSRAHRLMRCG